MTGSKNIHVDTYSDIVRSELADTKTPDLCCIRAEIAGFIRFAGSLELSGKGAIDLYMNAVMPRLSRHYKILIKLGFGIDAGIISVKKTNLQKRDPVILKIKSSDKLLNMLHVLGIINLNSGRVNLLNGIRKEIIKKSCCRGAYLRGAFIACGTITDPIKEYLAEFSVSNSQLSKELKNLIKKSCGITPHIRKRSNRFIVYVRRASDISDLLASMGAVTSLLKLEDVMIQKDLKNKANRLNNYDSANIDKTLEASQFQLNAINDLISKGKFNDLSDELIETAKARLDNPDASLSDLSVMLNGISRSTIYSRLNKIINLSKDS